MRLFTTSFVLPVALLCVTGTVLAQRHDGGSSPPTAPPPKPVAVQQPAAINAGLAPLQILTVNFGVSAPQSLTRQLQSSDERTRIAALAAIGAPGQYMMHGHVAFPRSVHLDFLALGSTDELDAILTVELDQHLLSAVMMPENEEWHRVTTVLYATAFSDPNTTPSTFLRTDRSLLEPRHYTAVFRASVTGPGSNFMENEAHLRILNNRAVVMLSFPSAERNCDPQHQHPCEVIERWLQADTTDADHRFLLVTATGHIRSNDPGDPIAKAETFETAHLRTFSCQPLVFSETSLRFEATASAAPCIAPQAAQAINAVHPATPSPN